MSPEELDARSDIFSFGLVLYEMATGCRAFPGNTLGVITETILNRAPTTMRLAMPQYSPWLERIVAKALRKDRQARFQHTKEIRDELQIMKREMNAGRSVVSSLEEQALTPVDLPSLEESPVRRPESPILQRRGGWSGLKVERLRY